MTARVAGTPSAVLANVLEERTGQRISAARTWRIEAAMRPILRDLRLSDLGELSNRVLRGDEPLTARITDALLNNETSFFRDAAAFEALRGGLTALTRSRSGTRRLRLWSAGCSTGQEAYSLAIMLRDAGEEWSGWTFDILATDVSSTVVARARAGRFTQFEIQRGLPVRTMLRWFRQEGEDWTADPLLRSSLRFATHNLLLPAPGRFDIILCRNVLMYFQPEARAELFEHLGDALDPGGMLMLGAGETVIGQTDRFAPHPELRGFYSEARANSAPRAALTA